MRVNLNVPFHEKDAAKSLGAWWDPGRKTWFVEDAEKLEPFQRWIDPRLLESSMHLKLEGGIYSLLYRERSRRSHNVIP